LGADNKDSITFVQITDSHIFDSGKIRPGQSAEDQRKNAVEITDSRLAWDWSLLEINRLALAKTVDFVVFTGDFGLEKVTTDIKPPIGCVALSSAVDDVARSFGSLLVNRIYVVRGNNDLDQEDPQDAGRFDDFIRVLTSDERLKGKQILNLTPALGNSTPASDLLNGIRIVGLDSSSFKNDPPKNEKAKCAYSAGAGPTVTNTSRQDYQLGELKRVSTLVQTDAAPAVIFTHVPDLDDPFKVDNPPKTGTATAWNIESGARDEWNRIITDKRLLAVFAGHLHDANRSRYLPPYSWQLARASRPSEVYEKTYLAPPLAAKFQMERAPQARGYLFATMTAKGIVRAEIRWFGANSSDLIVAQPSPVAMSGPTYWNYVPLGVVIAVAGLLGLVLFWLVLTKRLDVIALAGTDGVKQLSIVIGSAALSLLIIAVAKSQLGVAESATLIALILIPLIVYGVVSGRLTEFKGPGGWSATFKKVSSQAVELTGVAIEDTVMIEKMGPRETLLQFEQTQAGKPVIMTLTLGNQNYIANAIRSVVKDTAQYPEFKFVVFVEQQGKVVSYAPVRKFRMELERDQARSERLVAAINSGMADEVRHFPEMRIETVSRTTSNADALEKMEKLKLDAILAVDENDKPIGVVERQHIVNQMVMTLAKRASE
jgi:CBS domain-containing protein